MHARKSASGSILSAIKLPAVIVAAAGLVLAINMGVRQTFGVFLEPMTADLGIGRADFSLVIAIQNILWGVLTPIFGGLADRYGTARCVALGGVLYAVGTIFMALSDSLVMLHLSSGLLIGMAVAACGYPIVLSAVARAVSEEKRSFALAVAATGGSVGQFLLLPLSRRLIDNLGWIDALFILAALAALAVIVAPVLKGRAQEGSGDSGQPEPGIASVVVQASKHRGFLLLNGGFFVCGFHVSFIATHLPGYVSALGFQPVVGADALSIVGFFNILGGLLAGILGLKFRRKYVLSGIYTLRAIVMLALILAPKTEATLFLFAGIFGLLWLSTVPLTSALVSDIFGPRFLATLFGIVMFSHQLGAFFGAWFGGISFDLTGSYDSVWYLSILLGVVSALFHWPIADRRVALATS
ncbi:MAG: MFS transporter, partial [Kiloniellales bacterium]|nr:MFS transporter [Kiloniellales bacterium]